ncbi:MAG TPA: adenylate/guanylate cyclase domain-containing protein [Opitutaceae bacterium]
MASPKKSALYRLRWLLLAPVPIAWCVIAHLGGVLFLENTTADWRFRYRGPLEAPVKVVYVNIDSLSLDGNHGIGGWPWSREYFAVVCKTLVDHGAKAIGVDVVMSDDGVAESVDQAKLIKGNMMLGRFLYHAPNVFVAASYVGGDAYTVEGKKIVREFPDLSRGDLGPVDQIEPPELPSFMIGPRAPKFRPPGVALIDTVDAGTRWVMLFAPSEARTYYAMGLELACSYLGVDRKDIRITADRMDLVRPDGSVAARIPLFRRQMLEINWFSKWQDATHNPFASIAEVYQYCTMVDSRDPKERAAAKEFFKQFEGAVVLIGPTDALTFHDVSPTPMNEDPVPRVSVHGNLFKTIVTGKYIRRLPEGGAYAVILGLSALVAALSLAGGARAAFAKILAVLSLVAYVAVAFQVFKTSSLLIPVVSPLAAAFSTSFVGLIWQIVEEQKQKGRIKGMFGTYLSPVLVHQMVDSGEEPRLGGVVETITAYFSDIEGFSTISELLPPDLLVELMNEYLSACTDILQEEGGTLDKYIGDAVIMIYGAPVPFAGHAMKACMASLRVQKRIAELRAKWTSEGDKWPGKVHRLQARVGLNTGQAVVGNMGSSTRFAYTMMGDDVNLAARMESGAKSWGVYTMCTEATRAACEGAAPGRVFFRSLGRIVVKGKSLPVPIFELMALSEDVTGAMRECARLFEEGLARHYKRDWAGALELFRQSEPLEVNGPGRTTGAKHNPSLIYIGIVEGYRARPPEPGWDGVFVMTEK